jgi:hypothetical protein
MSAYLMPIKLYEIPVETGLIDESGLCYTMIMHYLGRLAIQNKFAS